ncbi:hypothetical protein WDW89_26435, partial [Deltaproteobacteria bacterium TL4]
MLSFRKRFKNQAIWIGILLIFVLLDMPIRAANENCTSVQSGTLLGDGTNVYNDANCGDADDNYIIASGHTLTWDGTGGPLTRTFTLQTGGTLNITGAGGLISGNFTFAGGTLDVDQGVTLSGILAHTASSVIDIADTKTLSLSNTLTVVSPLTMTLNSSGILDLNGGLTVNGTLTPNLATVDISGSTLTLGASLNMTGATLTTASTNLTLTTNATLTSDQALTIATLNLGNSTLTLGSTTTGLTIANEVTLDNASETIAFNAAADVSFNGGLKLSSNGTFTFNGSSGAISGNIILDSGTLDVDVNTSISNAITHTASSFINLATGTTLIYSGNAITLGAFTLTIQGAGAFSNTNAITLDNASSELELAGTGTINVVTVSTGISTIGKGLDVNDSLTITTLNMGGSLPIDVDNNKTLTIGSGLTVDATETLMLSGTGTLASSVVLNAGTLDVESDITLSGNLTHIAASSISIASTKTLTYSGAAVNVGAATLTFSGAGAFNNTNAIILNDAASELQLNGGGTLGVVTVSTAISAAGKGLDVDESLTITTLNLSASLPIDVASGKTLTVTSGLSVDSGETLKLNGTGTLASAVVLNAGTLAVDDSLSITGNITHTAASIIDIADTKTLSYSGNAVNLGAFTLMLPGAG